MVGGIVGLLVVVGVVRQEQALEILDAEVQADLTKAGVELGAFELQNAAAELLDASSPRKQLSELQAAHAD